MRRKLRPLAAAIELLVPSLKIRTLFMLGHFIDPHLSATRASPLADIFHPPAALPRGGLRAIVKSPEQSEPRRTALLDSAFQFFGEVGLLPGKAAVCVRLAAEMAIGGRAGIDWAVEAQMLADTAG